MPDAKKQNWEKKDHSCLTLLLINILPYPNYLYSAGDTGAYLSSPYRQFQVQTYHLSI